MNNLLTMDITALQSIKQSLHKALGNIEPFEQCALIGYPNSGNIGDNLIWLSTIVYLSEVLKTQVKYASTGKDFSASIMERKVGKAPILIQGGGSLGDIWYENQKFKEAIISKYPDRKIIILPQTIKFVNSETLQKAVKVFNSHPQLTLFTRDDYSYEFALKHFYKCRVIKAPDMAFQMVNTPGFSLNSKPNLSAWYLRRKDKELDQVLDSSLETSNVVTEDWVSYERKWAIGEAVEASLQQKYGWLGTNKNLLIQGAAQLLREGWQRGLTTPSEWMSRQIWEYSCPYKAQFNSLDKPYMHRRALSFVHSGIYQLKKYHVVITSRLHGHIFCILLGIPHVFLPNAYHKNEAFYKTWTYPIPFCRFVKDASQVKPAVQELMELYAN